MNSYWNKKLCHTDGQYLFNVGKAKIHAGSRNTDYKLFDLVINVSGYSYTKSIVDAMNGADKICQSFLKHTHHPDDPAVLTIDWPDGQVPQLRRKDWRRLIADLQVFGGKVLVHCFGGHGRTGTALAILAHLSDAIPGDCVTILRKKYCEEIVETEAQVNYLTKHIGIKTVAKPTHLPLPPLNYQRDWVDKGVASCNADRKDDYQENVYVKAPDGTWKPHSWLNYNQNKGNEAKNDAPFADVLSHYDCIHCQRRKSDLMFYEKFMNGTGVCWMCHQRDFTKKFNEGGYSD